MSRHASTETNIDALELFAPEESVVRRKTLRPAADEPTDTLELFQPEERHVDAISDVRLLVQTARRAAPISSEQDRDPVPVEPVAVTAERRVDTPSAVKPTAKRRSMAELQLPLMAGAAMVVVVLVGAGAMLRSPAPVRSAEPPAIAPVRETRPADAGLPRRAAPPAIRSGRGSAAATTPNPADSSPSGAAARVATRETAEQLVPTLAAQPTVQSPASSSESIAGTARLAAPAPPVAAQLPNAYGSTDSGTPSSTETNSTTAVIEAPPPVMLPEGSAVELRPIDAPAVAPPVTAPAGASSSSLPSVPAGTASAAVASVTPDRTAIESVLSEYSNAFSQLDAAAAAAVWPTVDTRTLARAFERLEQQEIIFDSCDIAVSGARADARCDGEVRYVPKVGNRNVNTEARRWTFVLRKGTAGWSIDTVNAR